MNVTVTKRNLEMESSGVHFCNFMWALNYIKFMFPQIIVIAHTLITNQDVKSKQKLF